MCGGDQCLEVLRVGVSGGCDNGDAERGADGWVISLLAKTSQCGKVTRGSRLLEIVDRL